MQVPFLDNGVEVAKEDPARIKNEKMRTGLKQKGVVDQKEEKLRYNLREGLLRIELQAPREKKL